MQDFEQMMNLYHTIFIGCGIAALLFLLLGIILFFVLKIPQTLGELTGRVARKEIEQMVELSAESGDLTSRRIGEDGRRHRTIKSRTGALGTSKLRRRTGSLSGSLTTQEMTAKMTANMQNTANMTNAANMQNAVNMQNTADRANAASLSTTGAVAPLSENLLKEDVGANETTLLESPKTNQVVGIGGFVILRSLVEIHTDEVVM